MNSNNKARIAGALSCMDALLKFEQAAEATDMNQTVEQFFAQRLSNAQAFASTFGALTPRQEGALLALAEYVHEAFDGTRMDLEVWRPQSAMTRSERLQQIKHMQDVMDADSKVVAIR